MNRAPRSRLRRRAAGDTQALKRAMWQAVYRMEAIVLDPHAPIADVLRAAHALATLGGTYTRASEQTDVLERLEAVERLLTAAVAEAERSKGGRP